MLMKMEIIENKINANGIQVKINIPQNELVFPMSLVFVYLGIPYALVFLIVFFQSIFLQVILKPIDLIFLGFGGMLVIGIYYYYIYIQQYRHTRTLEVTMDQKTVLLKQDSESGFHETISFPFNNIKQIIFGRSPHGPDGWSAIFTFTDDKKISLFIVNRNGLLGMHDFAQIIKLYLIKLDKLSMLRFSEAFLKNLKLISSRTDRTI